MAVLTRHIMKLRQGKWDKFVEFSQKYRVLTDRHGFPTPTIYRYQSGLHPAHTIVVEYLWESHTEMEATGPKLWADPASEGLGDLFDEAVETWHVEYLTKLDSLT
jgi:hypothetical protein